MEKLRKIVLKMYFVPWKPEKKKTWWCWYDRNLHISAGLCLSFWIGSFFYIWLTPEQVGTENCTSKSPFVIKMTDVLILTHAITSLPSLWSATSGEPVLVLLCNWFPWQYGQAARGCKKKRFILLGLTRVLPLVTQMKVNHLSVGDCLLHLAWQW